MTQPSVNPFETIESAQDFLRVLAETIDEARQEIAADLEREMQSPPSRRRRALQIAAYNLDKLGRHMMRNHRILNDLRSLRRLLFDERRFQRVKSLSDEPTAAPKPDLTPPLIAAIPAPRTVGSAPLAVNAAPPRQAIPA
jgi:hypothetical protein